MSIGSLFKNDITRPINPAVVVSNQKEETVRAEIEEYVFTDDLIEKLYLFLNTFINNKEKKTGIWINGYYGSGKSHFIKYVHYSINPKTREAAFQHYLENVREYQRKSEGLDNEVTESNVKLLKSKIENSEIDNIMFNVEDETDDGSGERLTRIFLSMFNRFRGYNSIEIPLALLFEKYLDRKGKFEEFKKKLREDHGYSLVHPTAYYTLNNIPEGQTLAMHEVSRKNSAVAAPSVSDTSPMISATAKEQAVAREVAVKVPSFFDVKGLLVNYTCSSCHNATRKQIGHAYSEIAERGYSNEKIVELIHNPQPQNWPDYATAMPPMPQVPKADAFKIAAYINSLAK